MRVESVARARKSFVHELREGWSAFVEHTWVWVLCLWIALYFLITYAPFFVLGPYIAKHSMSGASSWGMVVTGEGIGALLGALAGLRFRPRRPLVATALIFLPTAVQSVLLAFHAPVAALAPGRALRGVRVLVRLDRLGYVAAADDPAREARARRGVRLDERDGLPAGGLRARRPDRLGRRHARLPAVRRGLARREHVLHRPAQERARVHARAAVAARRHRLCLDEPERRVGALDARRAVDLGERRREHAHRLAVELGERAVQLAAPGS